MAVTSTGVDLHCRTESKNVQSTTFVFAWRSSSSSYCFWGSQSGNTNSEGELLGDFGANKK